MAWRRYWVLTAAAAIGALLISGTAILVVDPFETVRLTPWLDRQPMARDKRYALPGLARKPRFDSVIVGSSSARLVRPAFLDHALGASFVNLSLDGSVPSEHLAALRLFLAYHPRPKAVVIGMDPVLWCVEDRKPEPEARKLPDLLFDANPWNELPHMLNWRVLRQTAEQALYLAGVMAQKWGKDGYTAWPQSNLYDPARAEALLYPKGRHMALDNPIVPAGGLPADRARWRYDNLAAWFMPMLDAVPAQTLTIAMVPPAHRAALSQPGTPGDLRLAECKRRIALLAACHPGVQVVDFAFDSDITRHDRNFWDPTHVTIEAAERIQALLVEAVRDRRGRSDLVRYVDPAEFPAGQKSCERGP